MLKNKHVQKRKSSSLFLIEMIMALLFMMISGAVIMTIFARAAEAMRNNDLKDSVVLCSQSIAEIYSVNGDLYEAAEEVLGTPVTADTITLDRELRYSENGEITLTLSETTRNNAAGTLKTATAEFTDDSGRLFSLTFSAYIPDTEVTANE